MSDPAEIRTEIELHFPLGTYNAQSSSAFAEPEWPPHPVRVLAALVAAAASLPPPEEEEARAVIDLLAACCVAPTIVAPRVSRDADGRTTVGIFRGASRWAPRNHELGELKRGVHPRELGRERAAVEKGGVAVGDLPVRLVWRASLDDGQLAALRRAAAEVAFVGTSRSPVVMSVDRSHQEKDEPAWVPHAEQRPGGVDIRVPTPDLPAVLDAWHERRRRPTRRDGAPARAPFVPPASLGRWQRYAHTDDLVQARPPAVDPEWWGDMLVLAIDRHSDVQPKAPAAFALARAVRSAMLSRYGSEGTAGEAPLVLRARGSEPHAAFVPLPFVEHPHANGGIRGIAIVLPHQRRVPDVLFQRRAVERVLQTLLDPVAEGRRSTVGVPGVGNVLLGRPSMTRQRQWTLEASRWRRPSATWSTVTPVVHSRYRRNGRPESLLEQVAADCRDAGLPEPERVEVLRVSRFIGAPTGVARRALPKDWTGPLQGPTNHLELTFSEPVAGPVLLGRARHFGLGLCLSVHEPSAA